MRERKAEMLSHDELEDQLEKTNHRIRRDFSHGDDHDWTYEEVRKSYNRARLGIVLFGVMGVLIAGVFGGWFAGIAVMAMLLPIPVCILIAFFLPLRKTLVLMEKHNADTFSQLRRAVAEGRQGRTPSDA